MMQQPIAANRTLCRDDAPMQRPREAALTEHSIRECAGASVLSRDGGMRCWLASAGRPQWWLI